MTLATLKTELKFTLELREHESRGGAGYYNAACPAPYSHWSRGFTFDSTPAQSRVQAYDTAIGYLQACRNIIDDLNSGARHVTTRAQWYDMPRPGDSPIPDVKDAQGVPVYDPALESGYAQLSALMSLKGFKDVREFDSAYRISWNHHAITGQVYYNATPRAWES